MPFTRLVKRYEPRLRATPRKRVVYEPRALCSVAQLLRTQEYVPVAAAPHALLSGALLAYTTDGDAGKQELRTM